MLVLLLVATAAVSDTARLRVLSLNDVHGALVPATSAWSGGRPVGGLSAIRQAMATAADSCACPVLRLDAGDEMQGTLLSNLVAGRSTIEGMNLLAIDVAAVGNHDLDWGQDSLRVRQRESRYGWVAANVFDSTTHRRPDWARPYVIVPRGGLRIAVVGYLTSETKTIVSARHVAGLVTEQGVAPIRDALDDARRARPDFVILLAHAGGFCTPECTGEIVDLARALPPGAVDLIVSGHTHSHVNTVVNGIPIVQSWSNGRAIGVTDLWRDRTAGGPAHATVRVDTVFAVGPADSAVAALVARYQPVAAAIGDRVVATLRDSLLRRGAQYRLGNLLADALRVVGQGDVGLINNGGIRTDLFPGPVTYARLFELQPFQNRAMRVTVSGAVLRAVLEHAVSGREPDAHVSGLTVRWNPARPPGRRIAQVRFDDGRPLRDDGEYTLVLGDFLWTGGGGYAMLTARPAADLGMSDLELTLRYFQHLPQPIGAPAAPRFLTGTP